MEIRYPNGSKDEWLLQAKCIANGNIKISIADIPMLLEWLKDMNWPGASIIAEYLVSYGQLLTEPIRDVLKSGDMIWIYWVLISFQNTLSVKIWESLNQELKSIAYAYDEEGAHIESLKIISKFNLDSKENIKKIISILKIKSPNEIEEYQKVESFLQKEKKGEKKVP